MISVSDTGTVTGQFNIDPASVLCRWVEEHQGLRFYYVAHVRDGKLIRSYSNYADPLDSNARPLDRASSSETCSSLPFVNS